MKKILLIFSLACLISACSTKTKVTTDQNTSPVTNPSVSGIMDGSSFEKAIVINEQSESKGVDAEYAWLSKHYPGYRTKKQSLTYHDKKPFDIISIVTGSGEEKNVYFDISNFFGKF
jgi:hypothetical protein